MSLLYRLIDPLPWFSGADTETIKKLLLFTASYPHIQNEKAMQKLFLQKLYPIWNKLPWTFQPLFFVAPFSSRLLRLLLDFGMNQLAGRFIAGNGIAEIEIAIKNSMEKGYLINIDILRESLLSEEDARNYIQCYIDLINILGPRLPHGTLSLSTKTSGSYSRMNAAAPEYCAEKIATRYIPVVKALQKYGGHIYFDALEYEYHEIDFYAFKNLYKEFGSSVRIVVQALYKDGPRVLERLIAINNQADPIWVRLVRGAYLNYEIYLAELLGWNESPTFIRKEDTDSMYECLLYEGLARGLVMVPAGHNPDSILMAEKIARSLGKTIPEYQFLYGLGEAPGDILVSKNIPARFYMPCIFPKGKLAASLAYNMRRVDEAQYKMVKQAKGGDARGKLLILEKELMPRR